MKAPVPNNANALTTTEQAERDSYTEILGVCTRLVAAALNAQAARLEVVEATFVQPDELAIRIRAAAEDPAKTAAIIEWLKPFDVAYPTVVFGGADYLHLRNALAKYLEIE